MADSTAVSIYTKLDRDSRSIRLLNILPDLSSDGLIQCTMHHTTIEASENEYSCLSYVWGPPTEDLNAIIVNGYVVHIRPNLFNFLSDARTRFTEKQLWIDALCIDQSNILERNHQVQQMGDIYSHAAEVLVWLAKPGLKLSQSEVEIVLRDLEGEELSTFTSKALMTIQFNKYWRRAWIVQEFVLAKRIYILLDRLILSPVHIERMAVYHGTHYFLRGELSTLLNYRENYLKRDPASPPLTLCRFFMEPKAFQRDCIDPRDRVFSLRAICEDGQKVPVDYSISLLELIMSLLKLEEGKLCSCYIERLFWRMFPEQAQDSYWKDTVYFQIPSTKQPPINSSKIGADQVHELDLGPAFKPGLGRLSWCNGIIKYFHIIERGEDIISHVRFVKSSQGESLWQFSFWGMIRFSIGSHTHSEFCLVVPTNMTIGMWDL